MGERGARRGNRHGCCAWDKEQGASRKLEPRRRDCCSLGRGAEGPAPMEQGGAPREVLAARQKGAPTMERKGVVLPVAGCCCCREHRGRRQGVWLVAAREKIEGGSAK
jgi:hypothetical protein